MVGVGIEGVKSVREVWGSRPRGRILGLPPSWSRVAAAAEVADAGERLITLYEGRGMREGGCLLLTSVKLASSSRGLPGEVGMGREPAHPL